jgi:hypothetical protein
MSVTFDRRVLHAVLLLIAWAGISACSANHSQAEHAQSPDSVAGGEDTADANDPIVCRKEDVPGHRMPRRVCRHQSEIEAERAESQSVIQQTQQQSQASPTETLVRGQR